MNAIVYHGSADSRELIRKYEWHFRDAQVRSRTVLGFLLNTLLLFFIYAPSPNTFSLLSLSPSFSRCLQQDRIIHPHVYKFNAIITTYEMVMTDISYFRKIHWKYLTVDEAHRLKNKVCVIGFENLERLREHLPVLRSLASWVRVCALSSMTGFCC